MKIWITKVRDKSKLGLSEKRTIFSNSILLTFDPLGLLKTLILATEEATWLIKYDSGYIAIAV